MEIIIFDTTLRDGEQSPGASLDVREKVQIAHQLERLGVSVIEAGFPVASKGDFNAVKAVSENIENATVAALARAKEEDITVAMEAIASARRPRIHTFIATSDIHLQYKLKKTRSEVLRDAVAAVELAKKFTDDIEFSAEDAYRSDREYLYEVVQAVIEAGATTVNIPDTVGYAIPSEFGGFISNIFKNVPNSGDAIFSVHCHNDLGLAVANSIVAVQNGVRQLECTVNGLGERAGNAALEEIVMALTTRKDIFPDLKLNIKTDEIYPTSRMVSNLTGMMVQRNKAVVGENAFAHESGIHQDGMLKEKTTYEIMTPESIGLTESRLVLGKHSGRHALKNRLSSLGFDLTVSELDVAFESFKLLADKKKEVFDEDLMAIINDELRVSYGMYTLDYIHTSSGSNTVPTATVKLCREGKTVLDSACGDGPVDAAFKTIDRLTERKSRLIDYSIKSVTCGKDALGEVGVEIEYDGKKYSGRGISTDVIEASAKAYLDAVNRSLLETK